MEDLLSKSMRLENPRTIYIKLRPCVYAFYAKLSRSVHCNVPVLARAVLEDFYDRHCVSSEEVSGDEN